MRSAGLTRRARTFHTRTFMSSEPEKTYAPSPEKRVANTRCMRAV